MIEYLKQDLAKYTALAGLLGLLLLGLYLLYRVHHGVAASSRANTPVVALPQGDSEQIVVDPRNHTLIIKRPGKTTVTSLPDVHTVIDVKANGNVVVTAPQFGWEVRPFIGVGYSNDLRVALGIDGFYWKRLDIGGGIATNFHFSDPRVFAALSYNIKDNLRISITVDHKKTVGGLLSLRI